MHTQAVAQESTQFLSFYIGDEEYGISILDAREIIQYPTVTRVPSLPRAIRGVINLRGSVVPVIDAAILFGFAERPITRWTCVVVVRSKRSQHADGDLVGIIVDSVSQVIELSAQEIEPPPAFGTRVKSRFLRGMGNAGDRFVMLLDLDRLLSDEELHELDAADLEAELDAAADLHDALAAPEADTATKAEGGSTPTDDEESDADSEAELLAVRDPEAAPLAQASGEEDSDAFVPREAEEITTATDADAEACETEDSDDGTHAS